MKRFRKRGFWLGVLALLLQVWSCQKADLSAIDNLSDKEIAILGHGGMGFPSPQVNLPPDSFESLTKAVEGYAADGVEMDVRMSKDSVLFLYHDVRLQTLSDCVGCIYQWDSEKLDDCRYIWGFNNQNFSDHRLVRLERILERFSRRPSKPYVFLDLKTSPDCPVSLDYSNFEDVYIQELKKLFIKYDCEDWVIAESVNFSLLLKLQKEIPNLKLIHLTILDEAAIELAAENNLFGISAIFFRTSEELVKKAHDRGLFVILGIQKIRADAFEIIKMNPDFIYSDNIPLMQSILN